MATQYLGEIRLFAGNYAPDHRLFCFGQLLDIADYDDLYALLNTRYGGDGRTTFALPDLRGRIPVGSGKTSDGTEFLAGEQGGLEKVLLTDANMPAHRHTIPVMAEHQADIEPGGAFLGPAPPNVNAYAEYGDGSNLVQLAPNTVPENPDQAAIQNIQPSLCLNYIICASGAFPSLS